MEMEDCAFPLVHDVVLTDDPKIGFRDTNYVLLVGAKPRTKGMERKDLITENARIFSTQGRAINEHAARDVRVTGVVNPANPSGRRVPGRTVAEVIADIRAMSGRLLTAD